MYILNLTLKKCKDTKKLVEKAQIQKNKDKKNCSIGLILGMLGVIYTFK